jgi:hypothetical protein
MLESIADKVNQRYKDSLEVSKVWKGVSEAVNNAQEHAYSKPRQDGFEGMRDYKWWLLTQLRNERFTAAVCDLGCGYSETLKPEMWEGFLNSAARVINSGNKHTDAIEAAMEYGRSRTRLSERGRGSRDALTLLERHENGELFILSHGGYVLYKRLEGVTSKPKSFKLDFEVPGTIIWWNLPLEGKNENKH